MSGSTRPGSDAGSDAAPVPVRRRVARGFFLGGLMLAFIGFIALGFWQLERRTWKLDLIERVDARMHAPPLAPPPEGQWPSVSAARDEYRHVRVSGRFLGGADTRVQAVTELGAGFWLLSPLRRADGSVVLVNRGFVSSRWTPVPGRDGEGPRQTVTGLLRLGEPGGAFLRSNDPAQERWYSRDVQAIASARRLSRVAPYFIDAERNPEATLGNGDAGPVPGLTVVQFRNQHLQYALTWFALALMVVAAFWRVCLHERGDGRSPTRSAGAGQADSRND